jgi:hypothetical protein
MTCYKCDQPAEKAIEINAPTGWRTTTACSDHTVGRYISEVYDNPETKQCDYGRCYNDVHASRDYCSSHKYDHQR